MQKLVDGEWDDKGTPDPADDVWVSGNCSLNGTSPCIDSADGDLAPLTDMLGRGRVDIPSKPNDGTGSIDYADMGAYERQP